MDILIFLGVGFIGYAIGRASHILGGELNTPDHWIYGVIAIVLGGFYRHQWWGVDLIAFGIGHTISDLRDMINLKFYGPDKQKNKKFWGID